MENVQPITLENIQAIPASDIDSLFSEKDVKGLPDFDKIIFAVPAPEQKGFSLVYYQNGRCLVSSSLTALQGNLEGQYGPGFFFMVGHSLMVSALYLRIIQPGKGYLLLFDGDRNWIEIARSPRTLSSLKSDVVRFIGPKAEKLSVFSDPSERRKWYENRKKLQGYFPVSNSQCLFLFNGNEIMYIRTMKSLLGKNEKTDNHMDCCKVCFRNGETMLIPFGLGDINCWANGEEYTHSFRSFMINLEHVDLDLSTYNSVWMDGKETEIIVGVDINESSWRNFLRGYKQQPTSYASSFSGLQFITTSHFSYSVRPSGFAIM